MLRLKSIEKCQEVVRAGFQEFFDLCRHNMAHPGDLLLCQQNAFIYKGYPCVGMGNEGLDCIPKINSIVYSGIGEITEDNNYFTKYGRAFFNGTSELEKGLHQEKTTYLNIWENAFFLRVFTQVVRVLNGDNYDWSLNIGKLTPNGKSKHIREQIVKRLSISPCFQNIIKTAYVSQIRNAVAHSQYHLIQGGILYDNYQSDKYANLEGLTFEEWEQKYIYSYFVFRGLFQTLKQIKDEFYIVILKKTIEKGIPIKVSYDDGKWYETYLYPDEKGERWRFSKNLRC